MSKFILILVVGAFFTYGIANLTLNGNVTQGTTNAVNNYSLTKARNIANSTAEMIFTYLGDDISWRVKSPKSVKMFGGTATYTVTDKIFAGDSLIKILIESSYNNTSKSVTVYTNKTLKAEGFMPPGVKGVVTANSQVLTNGTITIDGRNHTMSGTYIPSEGTWGIWTTDKYVRKGASKVGGTYYVSSLGTDIIPTRVGYLAVVAEYQTYPGGYPQTPEDVLGGIANGYPKNILMEIAKTGFQGSQYVTNPAFLKYPLKGITYVDLPPGGTWYANSVEGSGLLIVHNDSLNAMMKNINTGTFRGLIIADDILKLHTNIVGAIVSLTPGPSDGIGNGNGSLKFSKEAVIAATEFVVTHSFGFRSKRVAVKHWFE